MVSIDPKALEHACLSAGRSVHHFDRMGDDLPLRSSIVAHARAIERLEAFKREVSDAIKSCMLGPIAEERLAPFILPAPDPLVEALASLPVGFAGCVDGADALRAAMQARGYEWRKIGEAGK